MSWNLKSSKKAWSCYQRKRRFVFNVKDSTRNVDVHAVARWKSLLYIHKKSMASIAYQAFYKRTPDGINSLFTKHFLSRNQRRHNFLIVILSFLLSLTEPLYYGIFCRYLNQSIYLICQYVGWGCLDHPSRRLI